MTDLIEHAGRLHIPGAGTYDAPVCRCDGTVCCRVCCDVEQLQLDIPICAIPACRQPSPAWGEPCSDCVEEFGTHLIRTDRQAPTRQELAARDAAVRAVLIARQQPQAAPEPERKQNQTCWLCDEKRTCTRLARGWECDTCREVS